MLSFFFFNDTATTEIYTLSLHDALPIYDHERCTRGRRGRGRAGQRADAGAGRLERSSGGRRAVGRHRRRGAAADRKSTRLNSSHANISYAVFCLKKKNSHFILNSYYMLS